MKKSYLALVEYSNKSFHERFTDMNCKPKPSTGIVQADVWIARILREHGTQNVKATIAEVIWSIT